MTMFVGNFNSSLIGDISLGVSSEASLGGHSFLVYAISCREILIFFDRRIEKDFAKPEYYEITSSDFVPSISSVSFVRSDFSSVLIKLSENLKTGSEYSIKCLSIQCVSGGFVSLGAVSFTVTAKTKAVPLSAFVSGLNQIRVSFDRPVGPYSNSSTFTLNSVGDADYPLSVVPYSSGLSNEITLSAPPGILPSPQGIHNIVFSGVSDSAGNSSSGSVLLNVINSHPSHPLLDICVAGHMPISYADGLAYVAVMCNIPVDGGFFSATSPGAHHGRPGTSIATSDATDLSTLINLTTSLSASVEEHSKDHVIHAGELPNAYTSVTPTDLDSCLMALASVRIFLRYHFSYSGHSILEKFPMMSADSLSSAISLANLLKSTFNKHVSSVRSYSTKSVPGFSPAFGSIQIHPLSSQRVYFAFFLTDMPELGQEEIDMKCTLHSVTGSTTVPTENGLSSGKFTPVYSQSLEGLHVIGPRITATAEIRLNSTFQRIDALYLNSILHNYETHRTRAIHKSVDNVNTILPTDYLSSWTDEEVEAKTEDFKEKFLAHVSSDVFHYSRSSIRKPAKHDFLSHSREGVVDFFLEGFSYGQAHRVSYTSLNTSEILNSRFRLDQVRTLFPNIPLNSEPPSISSVVVPSGDSFYYSSPKVNKRRLHIFFSKKMDTKRLPDCSFSPGVEKGAVYWSSERILSVDFEPDHQGDFTIDITAAYDEEGNLVY